MRRLRIRKRLRCRRYGHSYYAVWGSDKDVCSRCGKQKRASASSSNEVAR